MTYFTKQAIEKEFSNEVRSYLECGFIIATENMSGNCNSNVKYIDFVDPRDNSYLTRIWLIFEKVFNTTGVVIQVNQYTEEDGYEHGVARYYPTDGGVFEIVKEFYVIDERKDIFTDDREEVYKANQLRESRYVNKVHDNLEIPYGGKIMDVKSLSKKTLLSIIDRVKQNYGCKRANESNITSIKLYKDSKGKLYSKIEYEVGKQSGSIRLK